MVGRSRAAWAGRGPPAEMSQVSRAPGPPCKVVAWSREAVAAWIEWMGGDAGSRVIPGCSEGTESEACWDGCHVGTRKDSWDLWL